MNREYFLNMIAVMYYERDMTQEEIADKFQISRMTVSRILQQVRNSHIVEVKVKIPFELEEKLQTKIIDQYGISRAYVIDSSGEKEISELIGKVGGFFISLDIQDHDIIGFGVGSTVAKMVENITSMRTNDLQIVQLMGGLRDVANYNPLSIVQEICRKLKAKGTYLNSPVIVEDKKMRDSLLFNSSSGSKILSLWEKCDKAIFGIGALKKDAILLEQLISKKEVNIIKERGGVGNILGHYFNLEGKLIDTPLKDRLVSIPFNLLQNIKERIAVAGGEEKIDAIRGALHSGLITTLITDKDAAKDLVLK